MNWEEKYLDFNKNEKPLRNNVINERNDANKQYQFQMAWYEDEISLLKWDLVSHKV